jgi:conjugal transfer pilus assembly protein TrbC
MNTKLLVLPLVLAVSAGGLALAQSETDGLDLEAIRERAAEHTADAEALATAVRRRAEDLSSEAQDASAAAGRKAQSYAASLPPRANASQEPFDFDAMIREQAEAQKASLGERPRFIAFASLSMPAPALKALVRDMDRAGGITVLRGFPAGDAKVFRSRLAEVFDNRAEAGSLGIDPRLFRAFAIQAAPSFVMTASDFAPCDGFDCRDAVPPHDRMTGNVSVHQVLETFADGRGPGAAMARLHLGRLEKEEQR